jgi:hypothetical protein
MEQQLAPADLVVALNTVEAVQSAIRRADHKAAALIGFQLTVLTIALGVAEGSGPVWAAVTSQTLAAMVAAALIGGLAASLALLGVAMWPRLTDDQVNRFAFPALALMTAPPEHDQSCAHDEAWRLAMHLSRIATRKYWAIRLALGAMALSTSSIVAWLCLTIVSQ